MIQMQNLEQGYDPDTEFPPTGDGDERSDDDGQDTDISSTNIVDAALVFVHDVVPLRYQSSLHSWYATTICVLILFRSLLVVTHGSLKIEATF